MTGRPGRVTCDLSISVDGYPAGPNQTEQRVFRTAALPDGYSEPLGGGVLD
ncbi:MULTISPECIES: hypothetical protein [Streptomyces]|uniref:hypothetical protein n=1 Tax=Streptomyces TaxID=1883 RepID=UPI001F4046D6|nr:hypothetical protein [Streptomyces sp. NRRL S-4]